MKVVHKQTELLTVNELLSKAKEHETHAELEAAASIYERIIKKDPLNEIAYNRLMIIYRKEKEYKKELTIIKNGLKAFNDHYKSRKQKSGSVNPKISRISKSILKSTGLLSENGKPAYQEGPISKWEKRKILVEKKI